MIVEIKSERDRDNADVKAKEKAMNSIAEINEGKIKYCIIYTNSSAVSSRDNNFMDILNFIKSK